MKFINDFIKEEFEKYREFGSKQYTNSEFKVFKRTNKDGTISVIYETVSKEDYKNINYSKLKTTKTNV